MGDSADGPERLDDKAAASVRTALARILASDVFSATPQLSAFLSFVVERAVEGRAAELKGYTIAVEALGRPPDFDPQADPIVRVEAGRLRRALTQYYAGEGKADPVRMTMPVGGYVPVFAFLAPEEIDEEEPSASDAAAGPADETQLSEARDAAARRWPLAALLALAAALLALLVWYLEPMGGAVPQGGTTTQGATTQGVPALEPAEATPDRLAGPAQLVSVAIVVPQVPADPKLADALRRVTEVLVDVTARFDDLFVIKAPPLGSPPPDGVDYVFEINVLSTEGALEGFGRLRSARDGRIVWTSSSTRPASDVLQDQDLVDISRRLGTRLAEPFGIIHADIRQSSSSPAMQCIFQAFDYRRFMTQDKRAAARTCLEQIVERDPEFYPAWAQLALLLAGEYAVGIDQGAPLDRALSAALKAVRLAPSGARAQQAMMDVLFLRGSTADAIRAGREASNRNPYDPDIMADLGSVFVRLNRPAEGLPLLERAIESSAGRPPWYDFYAFLAAYLTGAGRLSDSYAAVLEADSTPLSLLGQALRAGANGDTARRDGALRQLAGQSPLFARDPRLYLGRKGFQEEVAQRILDDLGLTAR